MGSISRVAVCDGVVGNVPTMVGVCEGGGGGISLVVVGWLFGARARACVLPILAALTMSRVAYQQFSLGVV